MMRRILVIGIPGAGKSTLAAGLGAALDLPVIHLDALFWKPGWKETPRDEFRALTAELIKREQWVIDGHYGRSFDVRLPAADTVVLLDLPRMLCIWRVIRRWLTHIGRTRPDMGPGCPEKVDWEFIKQNKARHGTGLPGEGRLGVHQVDMGLPSKPLAGNLQTA